MRNFLIKLLYKVSGADIEADAAMLALAVINAGKIVCNMNSIVRTLLLAYFAAHAANFAELAGDSSFFYIVAGNGETSCVGDHNDHILGTCIFAGLAAFTCFAVNDCNIVYHVYSVKFAGFNTIAVTETAVHTIVHTVAQ